MADSVRALYVYDISDPAAPPPERVAGADERLTLEPAHGVGEAFDTLTTGTFDCVLTTHDLPDGDGLTLLRRIRDVYTDLPVVLHVRGGTEELASRAVSAGVSEYVPNDPSAEQAPDVAARLTEVASGPEDDTESRINELTEATDDVLWLISADWEEVLFVNSAYERIWGQSEATLRADPMAVLDAIHPDDRARASNGIEQLAAGDPVEVELRVDPTEEYQRRVVVRAEPIFDRDGAVERIAGVSREVTEQRAQQRRLAEETEMVDSIFTALPDVLYTFDTSGYLIRWNDQLGVETGYADHEIAEMYVTDFVPADEVENIAGSFQRIIQQRETVTVESAFETKNGDRIPFEFTGAPLEDADGNLRGVTGVGRNLTERKQQQRRFEAVFNNTYQFTGLMSPDGTLLEANQTAVEFVGGTRDQLVGTKLWETPFFSGKESARSVARRAVETARDGEFFRERITIQGSDREAVIDFSVRPVTDGTGDVDLLIHEGRDITRLSERERQLNVTNRFLRHNIRNKLTTIRSYAELVEERDDTQVRTYGDRIIAATSELSETAEMARDIHNLIEEDPTAGTVDLAEHLDRAVTLVEREFPTAEIAVEPPETVEARSIPSLDKAFFQCLSLLLRDAPDARVTIEVDVGEDAHVVAVSPPRKLSAAEKDVLTGEIEIEQTRHARGLGVWFVYWHVWYSGGSIAIGAGGDVRMRLPAA